MIVKIAKFEQYPSDFPTGIAVGFNITFENGRSNYIDTIVHLDLTEEEAVATAWEQVKENIETMKQTIGALPKLVGSIFTPPSTTISVNPEDLPGPGVIEEPIVEEETKENEV
jgi:hypothetical protein